MTNVFDFKDYRAYLKAHLEERCETNPQYSMRAFARRIDFLPSRLSDVLKGKKNISVEAATDLGVKLGHTAAEQEHWLNLVQMSVAKTDALRKIAETRVRSIKLDRDENFFRMQSDTLKVLTDWYHIAILELTAVRGFEPSNTWIAARLGISEMKAAVAIERLLRIGLLKKHKGKLVKTHAKLGSTLDIPSETIRKLHKDVLARAAIAIDEQPLEKREVSFVMMPASSARIAEAKRRITAFRRELMEFLEEGQCDTVYCMASQLFEVVT